MVLTPVDDLTVLLNPPSSLKPSFFQDEVQEVFEIHQEFATLDFSFFIEYQLWHRFEICCQALAHLKPNNSEFTQQLQHKVSNIRSVFPYVQDLFQELGALQMVEKDMDDLHSKALSTHTSYREEFLELQALQAHEEELLKSLADVRLKISKSNSKLATFEQ